VEPTREPTEPVETTREPTEPVEPTKPPLTPNRELPTATKEMCTPNKEPTRLEDIPPLPVNSLLVKTPTQLCLMEEILELQPATPKPQLITDLK